MKKIFFLFLAAIIALSFSVIDNHEAQVKKAAQEQLQTALAGIPAGQEINFGFVSREEFKSGIIGEVYRTITLTNDFYKDAILTDKDYIRVQNEWRVPVMINGENRVLLTVFGQDTALNIVDVGGALLAKEMQSKSIGQTQKEKFIFRIYTLTMDFIVFVDQGKTLAEGVYYPMNSALMGMPLPDGSPMTQAEVFHHVKKKLNEPNNQPR
ncbi:MAG: hypothetical protein M3R17_06130 [Bacteroidota bacterium]|nr:hypothetical protein [Bacteroidota bacterium]